MKFRLIMLTCLAWALAACATMPSSPSFSATGIPIPTLVQTAPLQVAPAQAPTLVPRAQPTSGLNPSLSTACNNPFYPVSSTATWQYRVTAQPSEPAVFYSRSIKALNENSFTEHYAFADQGADNRWTCSADGLVAAQFANLHVHGQKQFQFDTTRNTGINLPPASQWTIGKTWANGYQVQGRVTATGFEVAGTGTLDIQNTIAAQEDLAVPAGTFTAFRVDSRISIQLTPSGPSLPVTLTLQQSSWYARDVGLVKSTLGVNDLNSIAELTAYTR